MFQEMAPGIITCTLYSAEESKNIINSAERNATFAQANVANYHDPQLTTDDFEIKGFVDLKARNALVAGAKSLPNQCAEFELKVLSICTEAIWDYWKIRLVRCSAMQLVKYGPGCHIRAHTDTATAFSKRVISVVAYLNEGYAGGEICFPLLGVKFRPKAGSVLMFPSDYLHSVSPVSAGERYVFVTFLLAPDSPQWI